MNVWCGSFLAVNHHKRTNWVPLILTHNLWLIFIGMKQKKFKMACFRPYVEQPDDHIGWATSLPFTSIYPTDSRTNPWNFHEKILRVGAQFFFNLAILILFSKSLFSFYVLEWMGLNFYNYDGLQPKMTHTPNHTDRCRWQNFCPGLLQLVNKVYIFWEGHKVLQNLHRFFEWQYLARTNN